MEYYHGPTDADIADIEHDRAEKRRKRDYPRGQGPTYDELADENSSGPDIDDPEGYSLDQHDSDLYLSDPGFNEDEVDDHPDPDHGREDHRVGAILTQREQWPHRMAAAGKGKTVSELAGKPKVVRHDEVKRLPGKETGLYGADEDDTYDVYAQANPKGDGWDVIKPISG